MSKKQYTFSQYEKENHPKLSQICSYGICSKGHKNEFETAVVNEPSVFEPSKFYCTLRKCNEQIKRRKKKAMTDIMLKGRKIARSQATLA